MAESEGYRGKAAGAEEFKLVIGRISKIHQRVRQVLAPPWVMGGGLGVPKGQEAGGCALCVKQRPLFLWLIRSFDG